tara:strand:- start:1108 stop:1290 length:183 start_codon:yes stop_codon:yes gene_type:complete
MLYDKMTECPTCKEQTLHEEEVLNCLSRKDNKTYICGNCGLREALSDLRGHIHWDKGEQL